MMNAGQELTQIRKQPAQDVDPESVHAFAMRLFRKNLAAQFCAGDHPVFVTEDKLIRDSMEEIGGQLTEETRLHHTLATIHLQVMDSANFLAGCPDAEDLDEETISAILTSVERDSLNALSALGVAA